MWEVYCSRPTFLGAFPAKSHEILCGPTFLLRRPTPLARVLHGQRCRLGDRKYSEPMPFRWPPLFHGTVPSAGQKGSMQKGAMQKGSNGLNSTQFSLIMIHHDISRSSRIVFTCIHNIWDVSFDSVAWRLRTGAGYGPVAWRDRWCDGKHIQGLVRCTLGIGLGQLWCKPAIQQRRGRILLWALD